jgi:hypothetical protein
MLYIGEGRSRKSKLAAFNIAQICLYITGIEIFLSNRAQQDWSNGYP